MLTPLGFNPNSINNLTEDSLKNTSIHFQNQEWKKTLIARVKVMPSTTIIHQVHTNSSQEKTETKFKIFLDEAKEKFLSLFSKKESPKIKVDLPNTQEQKAEINLLTPDVTSTFEGPESQEIEEFYKEIFTNFKILSPRIDSSQQQTIRLTLQLFSDYDKNLKNIIPELIQEYGPDGDIPKEKLPGIQQQLHRSTGAHLLRIKNLTPRTLEKYFQGQLNQVKELYETCKQEDRLELFYLGCYSRFPGCFEDRILHLYKSTTAEKELQATASLKDNSDPLLPPDMNVALSEPYVILSRYHNSFTKQQEAKMKDDYPELRNLTISEQLDYREEQKLDEKYLSRSLFEAFLATTKISQLQTSQGLITTAQIENFWQIIST